MPDEGNGGAATAPVAGVLLAAGTSSRMGGPNKMFLEVGGRSLLFHAASRAVEAGLDPVLVVVGHEAGRARAELGSLPVAAVENPGFVRGINGSLRVGVAAVPSRTCAAVVLLADMPRVTSAMIGAVVSRYRESGAALVVSEYGGVHAPPTLYDRRLFGELGETDGEGSGKEVVRRHRAEAAVLAWPAEALQDIDRPEDWVTAFSRRREW